MCVRVCSRFFGEDSSKASLDSLLSLFSAFFGEWKEGWDWLEKRRLDSEKQAKLLAEKERKEREREEKKILSSTGAGVTADESSGSSSSSTSPSSKPKGLVDGTLSTLSSKDSAELMKAIQARRDIANAAISGGAFKQRRNIALSITQKQGAQIATGLKNEMQPTIQE